MRYNKYIKISIKKVKYETVDGSFSYRKLKSALYSGYCVSVLILYSLLSMSLDEHYVVRVRNKMVGEAEISCRRALALLHHNTVYTVLHIQDQWMKKTFSQSSFDFWLPFISILLPHINWQEITSI